MKAFVEEMSMPISKDIAKKLYKVEYTAKEGNGYDSGNLWATFGVYEKEEIAEFIRFSIENGDINPLRK